MTLTAHASQNEVRKAKEKISGHGYFTGLLLSSIVTSCILALSGELLNNTCNLESIATRPAG